MVEFPKRRSVRLMGYDYAQAGLYFITICTYEKQPLLGEIVGENMVLNAFGRIVEVEWQNTGTIRPDVELDVFTVMPNHFHALLFLHDERRGTLPRARRSESFGSPTSNSVPTIVRLFKSAVTTQINTIRNTRGNPVWQRGYHEHVVRDENDLHKIREYIENNALKWHLDRYYKAGKPGT
jgi:putative transposase